MFEFIAAILIWYGTNVADGASEGAWEDGSRDACAIVMQGNASVCVVQDAETDAVRIIIR